MPRIDVAGISQQTSRKNLLSSPSETHSEKKVPSSLSALGRGLLGLQGAAGRAERSLAGVEREVAMAAGFASCGGEARLLP